MIPSPTASKVRQPPAAALSLILSTLSKTGELPLCAGIHKSEEGEGWFLNLF